MEYVVYFPCGRESECVSERRQYLNNFEGTLSFGSKFP